MCGIAGISRAANSNLNTRALAHALLSQIENRGSHASGFAFTTDGGDTGVYKDDKPGSQLPLGHMPRDASTVILHTRFATQGDPQDNRNNHPVMSPGQNIALVHNGVISNDYKLRPELGLTSAHGEVDSLVIPAVIEKYGASGMSRLAGYAAVAYIDNDDPHVLNIAKLKQSPVAYTWLYDGSFVMASTAALLRAALDGLKLNYGGVFELGDARMIEVTNGFIQDHYASPKMTYDYGSYSRFSSATSGTASSSPATSRATGRTTGQTSLRADAKGNVTPISTPTVPAVNPAVTFSTGAGSGATPAEESSCQADVDAYFAELEEWRARRGSEDQARVTLFNDEDSDAMALASGYSSGLDFDDEDEGEFTSVDDLSPQQQKMYTAALDKILNTDGRGKPYATAGYYTIDHDGDINHFPTLDDLEARLKWLANMTASADDLFPGLDQAERWANYLADMGSVDDDGELISWVDDMGDIDNHESPAVRHLQYIRNGIGQMAIATKS